MKRGHVGPMVYGSPTEPLDEECRTICDALNGLMGVETIASCCGHGYARFRIYFETDRMEDIKPVLDAISKHDHWEKWRVRVSMADYGDIYFILDGPQGMTAYLESVELAAYIDKHPVYLSDLVAK